MHLGISPAASPLALSTVRASVSMWRLCVAKYPVPTTCEHTLGSQASVQETVGEHLQSMGRQVSRMYVFAGECRGFPCPATVCQRRGCWSFKKKKYGTCRIHLQLSARLTLRPLPFPKAPEGMRGMAALDINKCPRDRGTGPGQRPGSQLIVLSAPPCHGSEAYRLAESTCRTDLYLPARLRPRGPGCSRTPVHFRANSQRPLRACGEWRP